MEMQRKTKVKFWSSSSSNINQESDLIIVYCRKRCIHYDLKTLVIKAALSVNIEFIFNFAILVLKPNKITVKEHIMSVSTAEMFICLIHVPPLCSMSLAQIVKQKLSSVCFAKGYTCTFGFRSADKPGCTFLCYLSTFWALQQWGKEFGYSVYSQAWAEDRLRWWLCEGVPSWLGSDRHAWRILIPHYVW